MSFENELEEFGLEPIFQERLYERYEFTVKVRGDEFKGHFHKDEIQWLQPHPRQMIGDDQTDTLEKSIYKLIKEKSITSEGNNVKLTPAFEGKLHERQQFTFQVQGKEYQGFIHEGEIQWFHPHPHQELKKKHVQAIEAEIHEKVAEQENE
ncbi:hypothetical protein [Domibacillus mangrovi]|uniref:HicA family toxin-antitoxin system n=1 Tax=Domibacillus mangrovi TaxID=1714354 RepID=A0A1Q5NZG3_9BACI|nr:hypothetical protein [Domibacillus mangrovi]OKL35410.1 hypothetical protein BLL40_15270 [Domibacillus mangrovi]